ECVVVSSIVFFFFFQAEDGIRDWSVTGVQTCALPISDAAGRVVQPNGPGVSPSRRRPAASAARRSAARSGTAAGCARSAARRIQIGRASWRERGESGGGGGVVKKGNGWRRRGDRDSRE